MSLESLRGKMNGSDEWFDWCLGRGREWGKVFSLPVDCSVARHWKDAAGWQ